jgi:hypothetical protein
LINRTVSAKIGPLAESEIEACRNAIDKVKLEVPKNEENETGS